MTLFLCVTLDNVSPPSDCIDQEALNSIHISKEDQENAFAMLAVVLWLGNIEFSVTDSEDHVEVVPNEGTFQLVTILCDSITSLVILI